MAAGLPVVVPRRGALPEHVDATGGGIVTPADDAAALAAAFELLATDRAAADRLSSAALAGVERRYTVRAMAERTVELYQSLYTPATLS